MSKKDAYLGIDIGAGGIKLVELHKNKQRPQLWTYGILDAPLNIHVEHHEKSAEELRAMEQEKKGKGKKVKQQAYYLDDPRIDEYAAYLKQLVKESRVTTKRATASLPVSYVFHSVVTLPFVEEKKLDAIVRAQIAKVISRPIEEMQIVYQTIPSKEKKPKYLQLLVTAAPRDLVAFYTAIFKKAGLQLEELETEAFALERALVGNDQATVMVVDIGSERTNFFIMDDGLPLTHRSIQIGGNQISQIISRTTGIEEGIDQLKRDLSLAPSSQFDASLYSSVTDQIIKEIEYGFDLYLKQAGNSEKRPEKIILTGGSGVYPPIKQAIENNFDVRVFVGDPWARTVYQQALKPALDEIGPRMAVCLGLALRNIVM